MRRGRGEDIEEDVRFRKTETDISCALCAQKLPLATSAHPLLPLR
jgi:hypothetical protein